MAIWLDIVIVILLAMLGIALMHIRDAVERSNQHLSEISERLEELCEPERERKKAIHEAESEFFGH